MNTIIDTTHLETTYLKIKEYNLLGKWIRHQDIVPLLHQLSGKIAIEDIGYSEEKRSIHKIVLGKGDKKILIWSQMHGNEATGTKAIFDFLNYILTFSEEEIVKSILNNCSIEIIPMLNPDGAEVFTRVNANNTDLNRDAVDLSACESRLLRAHLEEFNPKFCFNLHDQRTIFGVEGSDKPATISFLAPSEEETREITQGRTQTMNVIDTMNSLLQQLIPNHIGRYTDEFYPTATGDNFQKLGYNTILIEAGHFKNDYDREEVRKYNFYALLQGIYHIAINESFDDYKNYFAIPNNTKNFYDVIYRSKNNKKDIAYQYVDSVESGKFAAELKEQNRGDLSNYLAHKEFFLNE